jgi:hypothetical protein
MSACGVNKLLEGTINPKDRSRKQTMKEAPDITADASYYYIAY